jgi:acetyl-CoA carboxylase biotin carboxylase subunit
MRAIKRVLVANRGEIALRIIRACREMGVESVAVYSDADVSALHVRAADRAVRLGPAPAAESYLAIGKVIDAARATLADAIHPGYGFLAENSQFAAACADAGIIFVGPPADVIDRMGSKIAARALMAASGVPIVPGETPSDQSDAALVATAARVGYPLLVKASAGGGGKGMRVVGRPADLHAALSGARHEARVAFGDETLYVERLIERPRHVEVQVMADAHGHVVHLFERDCSVQRRHQKVIEESPSPGLSPALRERMTATAVRAARAAGYRNAGTIEFLVEGGGDDTPFYFLEMNTRLQVEHPVTEAVAGVDLVRAQLLVAAGEPLPWRQEDLVQRGHAIECRVYAEDPARDFLPQAGRLVLYREPARPGVRIDAGVEEGSDVPVHYDPLLAKVTAWGETRDLALARARATLSEFPILGIRTNLPFLVRLLDHPAVRAGTVDTWFLDQATTALLAGLAADIPLAAIAAAAVHSERARKPGAGLMRQGETAEAEAEPAADPWISLAGWRNSGSG